jgi:hypothetical protein
MTGVRRAVASLIVAIVVAACASPAPTLVPEGSAEPTAWEPGPDAPLSLIEQATAVHDGRIWIAGGLTADGRAFDGVRALDPASGEWVDGPSLPQPIHHAALVSDGTDLWLLGGYVGSSFDAPTDAVWRLPGGDLDDTWEAGPPLPDPRAAGAAVWDGSRLVYGGGVGPGVISDLVVVLGEDGAFAPVARLSIAREHLAAATDGAGRTWFLGGRQGGLTTNQTRVDVIEGDQSTIVGDVPTPRGGVAAFWWPVYGACLLGGEAPDRAFRDVECLDDDGDVAQLPPMLVPRHGFGAVVLDGTAYAVLGGPDPGLTVSSTIETLALP